MYIQYSAIDGFDVATDDTAAWLMADAVSDMHLDNSVNGLDLTVNGNPTESVVATGSTTLESSNFTNSNNYSLAYNALLDPGTGSLTFSFWLEMSSASTTHMIFQRVDTGSNQRYDAYVDGFGVLHVRFYDGTTTREATSSLTNVADGIRRFYTAVYDSTTGTAYLYINGALDDTTTGSVLNTLTNTSATLNIGVDATSSSPLTNAKLSGLQFNIGTALTAQQIKNRYDSSKVLYGIYELFSIKGNNIDYEIIAQRALPKIIMNKSFYKTGYDITTDYFTDSTLGEAFKFLKSTYDPNFIESINGIREPDNSFTIDLLGTQAVPVSPFTAYKTSSGETVSREGVLNLYNFSVRHR